MMKKMLVWLMAIMLLISLVPSMATDAAGDTADDEVSIETGEGDGEGDGEEGDLEDDDLLDEGDLEDDEDEEDEITIYDKALYYEMDSDEVLKLNGGAIQQYCLDETGENLEYIIIEDVSAGSGALWFDYDGDKEAKVKATDKYYRSSSSKLISNVTFVPKSSFDGEVEIYYTGYTEKKTSFEGLIIIDVTEAYEYGDLDKIIYYVDAGDRITFDASDINAVCRNAGFSLKYVTFTLPDADEEGVLYYNYKPSKSSNTKVKASTKYYKDTDESTIINNVTLVVSEDAYDNFDLFYTAYDSDGEKYIGILSIKVDSDSNYYDLYYEVTGECVFFTPADFNDVCVGETGARLDYVKFSSPSNGYLYYDYEDEEGDKAKVSTSKKYYYRGRDPYLYLVAYVPKADYEGTVYVDYEGFSVDGDSYTGTVTIDVETQEGDDAPDIEYSIKNTSYKTFSVSNFTSACDKATDEKLDYVKFSSPSNGTLYYKYSKNDDDNEKVSTSTKYFADEADYIKYVTYVPKSGYSGTATVKYTGYTEEGTRFSGAVKIKVTGTESSKDDDDDMPDAINYKGEKGKAIKLDGEDFYDACDDFWGDDLEYIFFTIPTSANGKLYYNYGKSDEAAVTKNDEFFYEDDDMLISDVTFVPAKAGTITVKYTAVTVEDEDFEGTVVFKVTASEETIENFKYQRMYNTGIFSDIDEDAWYGSKQTSAVKLAYRYGLMSGRADGTFDPSGSITVAEALTIAARVHDIYYNNKTTFKAGDTWYEEYVDYAIEEGIVKKNDFSNYDKAITREEMAYVFANIIPEDAMEEMNDVESLPDVDENNEYFYEIIYLYNVGILSGSDAKGTFNPKTNISRAEVSAIIVRVADPDERRENNF